MLWLPNNLDAQQDSDDWRVPDMLLQHRQACVFHCQHGLKDVYKQPFCVRTNPPKKDCKKYHVQGNNFSIKNNDFKGALAHLRPQPWPIQRSNWHCLVEIWFSDSKSNEVERAWQRKRQGQCNKTKNKMGVGFGAACRLTGAGIPGMWAPSGPPAYCTITADQTPT